MYNVRVYLLYGHESAFFYITYKRVHSRAHRNNVTMLGMSAATGEGVSALRSGSTIADEVYPRRGYC